MRFTTKNLGQEDIVMIINSITNNEQLKPTEIIDLVYDFLEEIRERE